jgi:hypothetical protein
VLVAVLGLLPVVGRSGPLLSAPEEAKARKLYLTKCAKCHKLYDPTRYTDKDWEVWMGKMTSKAKLSRSQAQLLSNYIEQQYPRNGPSAKCAPDPAP